MYTGTSTLAIVCMTIIIIIIIQVNMEVNSGREFSRQESFKARTYKQI